MKNIVEKAKERKGFAMTEMLLAVTCSLFMIAVAFTLYTRAKGNISSIDVIRQLNVAIENIRTYYAFDGTYAGLSDVSDDMFYKRDFLTRTWRCKGKKCLGPDSIELSFTGTADSFTIHVANVPKEICLDVATQRWHNNESVGINSADGYDKGNLPVSVKNATKDCSQTKNTVNITFR